MRLEGPAGVGRQTLPAAKPPQGVGFGCQRAQAAGRRDAKQQNAEAEIGADGMAYVGGGY